MSYKLEKIEKIQNNFALLYLLKKSREKKYVDVILSLKRSLQAPRKPNETMNPIVGLGHGIYELRYKRTKKSFQNKFEVFLAKKRRRHT